MIPECSPAVEHVLRTCRSGRRPRVSAETSEPRPHRCRRGGGRPIGTIVAGITTAIVALTTPPAVPQEPATAAVRERNVIRKQLPKNVKSIALEYTVSAIDGTGKERSVDPVAHTFKVGDSFLVRIRPQDDVYVYVFNEGPTGERACLLPSEGEKPPLVKKNVEISLPDDGGFFTFAEPAGEEKLVVVALTEPSDDMQLLTSAVFKAGRSAAATLSSEERAARKQADAGMDALRQRAGQATQSRGPVRKVVDRVGTMTPGDRVIHVEPPGPGENASYGIAISAGNPELFLDIPLRSKDAGR